MCYGTPCIRVSIHTPTQGVTVYTTVLVAMDTFQSTHPRRVWLSVVSVNKSLSDVSIHTPTQGVTNLKLLFLASWSFNPHTHAGCDSRAKYLDLAIACFNPHTHAGCDFGWVKALSRITGFNPHTHAGCDEDKERFDAIRKVSIHTPTQGVTWVMPEYKVCSDSFNPHTHAGCDGWNN